MAATTWPNSPLPHSIHLTYSQDTVVSEFENGQQVRDTRWHKEKVRFTLDYYATISADGAQHDILPWANIRDFLIARKFGVEAFNFVHPNISTFGTKVVKFDGQTIETRREVRNRSVDGTEIIKFSVNLIEVFEPVLVFALMLGGLLA